MILMVESASRTCGDAVIFILEFVMMWQVFSFEFLLQ